VTGERATTPGYGFAAVARIVGVPESKLRYWAQVGLVGPSGREQGKALFSFRDLVAAKATKELTDRGVKPNDIRRALTKVRTTLPEVAEPIGRLRIAYDGDTLLVVDAGAAFEVSGQRVFDFGLDELAAELRADAASEQAIAAAQPLPSLDDARAAHAARSAYDHFVEGLQLAGQPAREADAMACYERALALDPGLAAARTNWGTLAYATGNLEGARAAFEKALELDPEQAEARFNLANLLLEEEEFELAASELRVVLQMSPDFADAHYNLATALERLGSKTQAREHLERYLQLASAPDGDPWIAEARARLERL
jgi:tetratricopeptide (TPR) repeat protein